MGLPLGTRQDPHRGRFDRLADNWGWWHENPHDVIGSYVTNAFGQRRVMSSRRTETV